jgi:hypothetical protein
LSGFATLETECRWNFQMDQHAGRREASLVMQRNDECANEAWMFMSSFLGFGDSRSRNREQMVGGSGEISSIKVDKTWITQDYGMVFPGPSIFDFQNAGY